MDKAEEPAIDRNGEANGTRSVEKKKQSKTSLGDLFK